MDSTLPTAPPSITPAVGQQLFFINLNQPNQSGSAASPIQSGIIQSCLFYDHHHQPDYYTITLESGLRLDILSKQATIPVFGTAISRACNPILYGTSLSNLILQGQIVLDQLTTQSIRASARKWGYDHTRYQIEKLHNIIQSNL